MSPVRGAMSAMTRGEAREVYRHLSALVDEALKRPRSTTSAPSDGNVAVMTVMTELEKMGYVMVRWQG